MALEVNDREATPAHFTMTQHNLVRTYWVLNDTAGALTCLRNARDGYRAIGNETGAAAIEKAILELDRNSSSEQLPSR